MYIAPSKKRSPSLEPYRMLEFPSDFAKYAVCVVCHETLCRQHDEISRKLAGIPLGG